MASVANPYAVAMVLTTVNSWPRRKKLVMAKKVKKGSPNAANVMAGDGFRDPRATYKPVPPPKMIARNGASCRPNEPRKLSMINMQIKIPRNKKNTVPRLVAIAILDRW